MTKSKSLFKTLLRTVSMKFEDADLEHKYKQQTIGISASRYISLKLEYYLVLLVSLPVAVVLSSNYSRYNILIEWCLGFAVALIEKFCFRSTPRWITAGKLIMWTLALTILVNYIIENSRILEIYGTSSIGDSTVWDGFILALMSITFTRAFSNYWHRLINYQIVFFIVVIVIQKNFRVIELFVWLVVTFGSLIIEYYDEKYRRYFFKKNQESLHTNKVLTKFLDYFPQGVAVIREGSIEFSNRKLKETLELQPGTTDSELALTTFTFNLVAKNEVSENQVANLRREGKRLTYKMSFKKKEQIFETQQATLPDFLDIFKKWGSIKASNEHYQPHEGQEDDDLFYFADQNLRISIGTAFHTKDVHIEVKEILWEEEKAALFVIQDINEKLEMSHLKEANRYKDKLLSSISHELRTPLNCSIPILEDARYKYQETRDLIEKYIDPALTSSKLL